MLGVGGSDSRDRDATIDVRNVLGSVLVYLKGEPTVSYGGHGRVLGKMVASFGGRYLTLHGAERGTNMPLVWHL